MAFTLMLPVLVAQTRMVKGLHDNTPGVYALTNARVVVKPGEVLENSTLIIRDGIIEAVGSRIKLPEDAWVIDMSGKTLYPGFIDLWVEAEFPVAEQAEESNGRNSQERSREQQPADASLSGAAHWSPQVRAWADAASMVVADEKASTRLRAQGFALTNNVPPQGIFRGQPALMALTDASVGDRVVKARVAQALSFEPSREFGRDYPTSLMGSISLMRQTWLDAQWYQQVHQDYQANPRGKKRPEKNIALDALLKASQGEQPVMFAADDELAVLRAASLAKEMGLNAWVKGSGMEYRRLQTIKELNIPLILPLNFPALPEVDRPEQAMNISLEDLRHWDYAPENPGMLHQAGVPFALTSHGLKDPADFLKNLRLAVQRGLPREAALRALTLTPATMLGMDGTLGSLEAGKMAHLIVADGDLFEDQTTLLEVWVDGAPFPVNKQPEIKPNGTWVVQAGELPEFELQVKERRGSNGRLTGTIRMNGKRVSLSQINYDGHRLAMAFRADSLDQEGIIRLSASVGHYEMFGIGELAQGQIIELHGRRTAKDDTDEPAAPRLVRMAEGPMRVPSMEYGLTQVPEQPSHLLIRNATIWTQGPQGRLEGADLLIADGRIVKVGHGLEAPRRATIIDARGRHVTPGLIDPHLHASIPGGVNEVGNAIVSETRIEDVIAGDNIWTYRLLAGGLTTANLLHGSANPIGGQDGVIKMRWGALPGELLLKEASPGLKLALGENVKGNTSRYPNTRMGSEQIIRDAFLAAQAYEQEMQAWQDNPRGTPPRRNLQLEALVEVLNGERIIHAHAYRQDEIQMLIRLAEEFGFKIASFEHTVEGYKVAEVLAEHGAAAIIWTDWSSFKLEAYDGILYNARLLVDQGVLTSLHSDNTQLSTRMNWEAGKLLATGVDEITAMDLVTINPARILGADDVVGSLEPGKHADFVIWSDHPLSGFSHAEQTWIDGRKYFDRQQDLQMRQEVILERAALIQKIMEHKTASRSFRDITQRGM